MTKTEKIAEQQQIAEAVRQACLEAALVAYEDAGMNGLCHEGRWECALDALRSVDVAAIVGLNQNKFS